MILSHPLLKRAYDSFSGRYPKISLRQRTQFWLSMHCVAEHNSHGLVEFDHVMLNVSSEFEIHVANFINHRDDISNVLSGMFASTGANIQHRLLQTVDVVEQSLSERAKLLMVGVVLNADRYTCSEHNAEDHTSKIKPIAGISAFDIGPSDDVCSDNNKSGRSPDKRFGQPILQIPVHGVEDRGYAGQWQAIRGII